MLNAKCQLLLETLIMCFLSQKYVHSICCFECLGACILYWIKACGSSKHAMCTSTELYEMILSAAAAAVLLSS